MTDLTDAEILENVGRSCFSKKDMIKLTKEEREAMSIAYSNGTGDKTLFDTMTCDDCPNARRCNCAWDAYNTGGDCLASK